MDSSTGDPPTPAAEMRALSSSIADQMTTLRENQTYWTSFGEINTTQAMERARIRLEWDHTTVIDAMKDTRKLSLMGIKEADKADTIAKLQTTLDQRDNTINTLRTSEQDAQLKIGPLTTSEQQAQRHAASLQTQLNTKEGEMAALRGELITFETKNDELKSQLEAAKLAAGPPGLTEKLETLLESQQTAVQQKLDNWIPPPQDISRLEALLISQQTAFEQKLNNWVPPPQDTSKLEALFASQQTAIQKKLDNWVPPAQATEKSDDILDAVRPLQGENKQLKD